MQICHVLVAVVFVHEKACLTFRRHRACRMPCVSGDVTIADTTDSDSLLILGQLIITQRTRISAVLSIERKLVLSILD